MSFVDNAFSLAFCRRRQIGYTQSPDDRAFVVSVFYHTPFVRTTMTVLLEALDRDVSLRIRREAGETIRVHISPTLHALARALIFPLAFYDRRRAVCACPVC